MPPTLKSINKKLKENLILNAERDNFASILENSSFTDIFRYLWASNLKDQIELPNVGLSTNKKDARLSDAFRNQGNRLYRDQKLVKALEAYNYAVISAPHPETYLPETSQDFTEIPFISKYGNDEYSHLSFAYANRSALLYEMKKFTEALKDINAALMYGYGKQHKLCERRIKCLIGLGKFNEAHAIANLLYEKIDNFSLDSKEAKDFKSGLRKLVAKCNTPKKVDDTEAHTNDISTTTGKVCTDITNNRRPLCNIGIKSIIEDQTDDALSALMPSTRGDRGSVNSCVSVQFSAAKGRHLVARRDIPPGEVLMVEASHVSLVRLNSNLRSYCSYCLVSAHVPTPCPTCSLAVYCSLACRDAAAGAKGGHPAECSLLPMLVALQPDLDAGLAFRTFTALGWENFSKYVKEIKFSKSGPLDSPANASKDSKDNTNKGVLGQNDTDSLEKLLDVGEMDCRFLFSLEGNLTARRREEKLDAAVAALILLKIFQNCSEFWRTKENYIDPVSLEVEDLVTLGSHIMTIYLKVQCNAHCIKELKMNNESQGEQQYFDVGYGLYQKLSLLNHSCNANAHQSSTGIRKILYSISSIKKGEEITMSYGERFASHTKENRIKSLAETYHFKCSCIACVHNWPLFKDLAMKFSLRCCKCSGAVEPASGRCRMCNLGHKVSSGNKKKNQGKKGKKNSHKDQSLIAYDATSANEEIAHAWKLYNEAHKNIANGSSSLQDIEKVRNLLSSLDKYALMPNKPYIEAQETCMKWFDTRSNETYCW
ncbi:SET and MYND domain-containing protein 4 [Hyalella azteca]|uniref:SET and MYND domain-containing protein 4 n=1 Tax=Hyalella azteca TaxID=294128 RepID=A0A8B7NNU0_HYAAZ|nr:SET and MYND domain-containing protein 4 [Hyalella azteca]